MGQTLVTSLDALAALKIGVGDNPNALDDSGINQIGVSTYQFFAADVNKSGKVTSADALEILRMSVRSPIAIERNGCLLMNPRTSGMRQPMMVRVPLPLIDYQLVLIMMAQNDHTGSI